MAYKRTPRLPAVRRRKYTKKAATRRKTHRGTVRRKVRKTTTRKRTSRPRVGRKIKGGMVRSKRTGRMVRRISVKRPGSLRALGYGMRNSAASRHAALNRAVKKYGRASVRRKIGALRAWNAHRPTLRRIADSDFAYLGRMK